MLLKLLISVVPLILSTSFYELSAINIDGKPLSMEKLKGKTVAIGVVDGKAPDAGFVRFLDSLQVASPALQVIVVPANDLTKGAYSEASKSAYKGVKSSLIILRPVGILTESKDRSDLIQWLTSVEKNGHFQIEVVGTNALFVLSKDGELKSVFAGGFPEKALTDALQ